MSAILIATVLVAGVGLCIGLMLGFAHKKLEVKADPIETAIREALPGNNCGGCGFPGCDACAKAIKEGSAPTTACPVGGAPVAAKIAEIMGEEAKEMRRMVAYVSCQGDCDKANFQYEYYGAQDCSMIDIVPGKGAKMCDYGCLGFGNCVKVCEFDAIHIVNGIAKVDPEKCKACRQCMLACPRHLIQLVPYDATVHIGCSANSKGREVMQACKVGCITCTKCAKVCPTNSIIIQNNIPLIDYTTCTDCGTCAANCPRKIIN